MGKKNRPSTHTGLNLRPIPEVAAEWNRRSGEQISRGRVWQILRKAEAKTARALKNDPT